MSVNPIISAETNLEAVSRWSGWLLSVAFWMLLIVIAMAFAALILAPKLVRLGELQRRLHDAQWELVILQEQTSYLQQIRTSLHSDQRVQSELARVEFGGVDLREERFAVPEHLQLKNPLEPIEPQIPVYPPKSWRAFWMEMIAKDSACRTGLILFCLIGAMLGFGWLHESAWSPQRLRLLRTLGVWLAQRYSRAP